MATMILPEAAPAVTTTATAVLTSGVDGYAAGTHGRVTGAEQGCLVFIPERPERVARWARPRTRLLVPPALVVALH